MVIHQIFPYLPLLGMEGLLKINIGNSNGFQFITEDPGAYMWTGSFSVALDGYYHPQLPYSLPG